jgi:streptogramin lyase
MPIRRSILALAFAFVFLEAGGGVAVATTPGVATPERFPIRSCGGRIAPAPEEGILVTTCGGRDGTAESLVHLFPGGGRTSSPLPEMEPGPLVSNSDGTVWIAGNVPEGEPPVVLDRLGPGGEVQTYAMAGESEYTSVGDLILGADGAVWAAVGEPVFQGPGLGSGGGYLLRVAPDGSETTFRLPHALEPERLALGADGSVWFTAVSGSYSLEHSRSLGRGFVGRLDPAGGFALFPTPFKESGPGAIVARPGGRLWFAEGGTERIGTVGSEGTFGPSHRIRPAGAHELALGPEGDMWVGAGRGGLLRLTRDGRKVSFGGYAESVVTGREGDVWAGSFEAVRRVVRGRER